MNNQASGPATPQMGFDFLQSLASTTGVNKLGSTSISELDLTNPSGIAAGEALSRMVVDDRVLNMGMTTWRALLDRAISLGHTELYATEDDQMGLRTPGMRFGPINRMPDLGPEYVLRAVFRQRTLKALDTGVTVKSSRVSLKDEVKIDLVVTRKNLLIGLFHGRKSAGVIEASLEAFPISDKYCKGVALDEGLQSALAIAVPQAEPAAITQSLHTAAGQVLKLLGVK